MKSVEVTLIIQRILDFKLFEVQEHPFLVLHVIIFAGVLTLFQLFAKLASKKLVRFIFRRRQLPDEAVDSSAFLMHVLIFIFGVVVACHSAGLNIVDAENSILHFKLFQIKQTSVTIFSVGMFLFVFALFVVISKIIGKVFLSKAALRLRLDEGTVYTLVRISHYIVMLIGALVAFQFVGIDLSGLVVVFGALSVGIGFGLQNITSNFISGLIILIERPIKVGDRVTVGDVEGDVKEINIRSTEVRSINNISIIVPNAEFVSAQVINWSHGELKVRIEIDVGVSYGSDLDVVLPSLREVAEENSEILKDPKPEVLHLGFGDSSWNMRLRGWIANPKRHPLVRSDLNCAIVRKFRKNGVEIPFPQRDLHVRSPLPVPFSPTDVHQN